MAGEPILALLLAAGEEHARGLGADAVVDLAVVELVEHHARVAQIILAQHVVLKPGSGRHLQLHVFGALHGVGPVGDVGGLHVVVAPVLQQLGDALALVLQVGGREG